METELTTTEYIVTDNDIKAVKVPSKDIVRDELESESRLVEAIVSKWNEVLEISENKTIQFALIVNNLLKDFPDEKKKSIMLKVVKHRKLKTSISKDRIYQGLRLANHRPDLIAFKEGKNTQYKPYLKEDGSIFWEFYFQLYKYSLGNDSRVRLENEGKKNNWSVRDLNNAIAKERGLADGHAKSEAIKKLYSIVRKLNAENIKKLIKLAEELNETKVD